MFWLRASRRAHQSVFSKIYREKAWGGDESASGPGSTRDRASTFVPQILELFAALEVKSVLDAPCGDFNWAGDIAGADDSYAGVDIVPELIATNTERFGTDRVRFLCGDLTRDPLPRADLILCRDCLVHFSFADISAALRNFRRSGAAFLLTTTFVDPGRRNVNIRSGGWRALNLEQSPFRFPPPIALIDEHCEHSGGLGRDKRLALWPIDSI
jgi:SAM-dependent methyltransferase